MNDLIMEKLCVSYDKAAVLRDFTLRIKHDELAVILGPSGCGKSTLLTAISGLLEIDDGRIVFGDTCLYSKEEHINVPAEHRNIGFVFQSYALWPHMRVADNIAFPLKVRGYAKDRIKQSVSAMLDIVHMRGYERRYPGELSGGEKQRIALARSLVYQPSILLLDEPLANIDAHLKTSLIQEIKDIQRQLGVTMIYVTHDQSEAFEVADRIIIMKDGRIMQQGTPREIYRHSTNLFVASFIGKNNIFKKCGRGCPRFLKPCHRNQTVTIRPEDINIKAGGLYEGVVKDISYKGDRTECVIESGGVDLFAYMSNEEKCEKGNRVGFDIQRYHII
jgi:iron(III) transport system ATP-binding protein